MPSLKYGIEYGPPVFDGDTAYASAEALVTHYKGMESRGLFPLTAVLDEFHTVIVYAEYIEDDD